MESIMRVLNRFQKYIQNTGWLLLDKGLNFLIGFAVSIVLARYLGPENLGLLSYAMSLAGLFAVAGHMGLSGLVVRELVKDKGSRAEILGTTIILKFSGMLFGYSLLIGYGAFYEGTDSDEFCMLVVVGVSLLFRCFGSVDSWFQAEVQGKYSSLVRIGALVASNLFRCSLVLCGASVLLFGYGVVVESVVAALLFCILYKWTTGESLFSWRFSWARARSLLGQGSLVFIGSIFAVLYLKIDQVMLRWLVGIEEVGIYSVAVRLSEVWYVLPAVLVSSLYPRLIKLYAGDVTHFHQRLQQVFDLLSSLAIVIAVLVAVVAQPLIDFLFGINYSESAPILSLHIWAAVFIFMRAALSKWILITDMLVFSMVTQGLGALVNVLLNYYLIPQYGGEGAAWATLLSYAMASYGALLVSSKTRPVFWMMSKALIAPLRYPIILLNKNISS
tara:strand:- start:5018 stop:6352 length:1335 start_codon:yes stop_codon:yes gene_type:complete